MRRLARRLFTLCSAVSLLMCVAFATLWLRSQFVSDAVAARWAGDPSTSATYLRTLSGRGVIGVRRFDVAVVGAPAPPGYDVGDGLRIDAGQDGRRWTSQPHPWKVAPYSSFLGFSFHDGRYLRRPERDVQQRERDRGASFPHWLPVLVTAVAPALWFRRFRKARRARRLGLCLGCGYDLRASHGRCPECGAAVAPSGSEA